MAVRQSAAQQAPAVTAISPARQALTRVAQNFSVNLAPFPEEQQALAFRADATQAVTAGITSAETHRTAQMIYRDGKRLKRGIEEHWSKVKRWLLARGDEIRTIEEMDLDVVQPGLSGLDTAIQAYEAADRERIRREQERQRLEQERIAQVAREKELADMEKQALAAEGQSDQLSDRERTFVQRVYTALGVNRESERWLNSTAKACGFTQDNYGVRLMHTGKITAAIEGMRQAQALRDQATAVAEKPLEVTKVEVQSNTAKVSGIRTVTTWTGECVDFDLFIDTFIVYIEREALGRGAISEGFVDVTRDLFRELVMPNTVGGNKKARALHADMDRIPGWRHIKRVTKGG